MSGGEGPAGARPLLRDPRTGVLAVLLLVLLGCLGLLVPWTALPGAEVRVDPTAGLLPDQLARIASYRARVQPWGLLAVGLGLAVVALLGLTRRGSARVLALAARVPGGWPVRTLAVVALVTGAARLVTLPLLVRTESVRRDVGLSTRDWPQWAAEVAKGWLVEVALTGLALLAVLAVVRALPRVWWWLGAGVLAGVVVAGSFAYPLVVEPVFARTTVLPAGDLRDRVLALAAREGVTVRSVLVADASRRTTALNAYVSGFGSSRRVVLYDTLLAEATPAEVELVVAHELAHVAERDVLVGTLLGALGAAAAVVALSLGLSRPGVLRRTGASGPGDPRVIPLVLAVVTLGTFAAAPVTQLVSRRVEARADVRALDLTCEHATFVAAQRRLMTTNLTDPTPPWWSTLFFASHPGGAWRVALAAEHERLRPGCRSSR